MFGIFCRTDAEYRPEACNDTLNVKGTISNLNVNEGRQLERFKSDLDVFLMQTKTEKCIFKRIFLFF